MLQPGTLYITEPAQRVAKLTTRINSATSTVRSDRVFQVMYFRGALNHIFATVDEPPHDIGGVATSAPDASFGGEVIAVRGTNGAVWAIVNGSPWRTLGGIAT